ncbi:hypothetical protein KVR01_012779 [Diaporthe batatas]|uniref:uncharacterized protein n=1 Tax=Diaporthe batatas TaxID=748121 RepID=UPI001D03FAAE|nr:uncharacterized protein KVR01_012779 [Diaporthe batatas]KAG8157395.1 hypothetical protein KVR01_012779 [Diaporthe batatas]
MNVDDLVRYYGSYGFYQIDLDDDPKAQDAEVYSRDSEPRVPLHAHKVIGPGARGSKPEELICSSKMGDDYLIRHPRTLLQCPHNGSNRYEYGKVRYRFRYDEAIFKEEEKSVLTTRSGRPIKSRSGRPIKKGDTILTKSMSRIRKADATRTRSNRITSKNPRK